MPTISSSGDPHDTGVAPVPIGLLGWLVIVAAIGFGGGLWLAGLAAGGVFGAAGAWVLVGGLLIGGALVVWDQLTDFFATSAPPGREPDPDDVEGVGEPMDDLGPD